MRMHPNLNKNAIDLISIRLQKSIFNQPHLGKWDEFPILYNGCLMISQN